MKIHSRFKDYYDYVEHLYGGDPKLIYNRDTLGFKSLTYHEDTHNYPRFYSLYDEIRLYEYVGLSICGKFYILYRKSHSFDTYKIVEDGFSNIEYGKHLTRYFNNLSRDNYKKGVHYDYLDNASKECGQPVFLFKLENLSHGCSINLNNIAPKLGEIGIGSLIKPEQIYQDIAYYIGNVINHGVDIHPPTQVQDKDRIVQHGFDIKQSFRHRR